MILSSEQNNMGQVVFTFCIPCINDVGRRGRGELQYYFRFCRFECTTQQQTCRAIAFTTVLYLGAKDASLPPCFLLSIPGTALGPRPPLYLVYLGSPSAKHL